MKREYKLKSNVLKTSLTTGTEQNKLTEISVRNNDHSAINVFSGLDDVAREGRVCNTIAIE